MEILFIGLVLWVFASIIFAEVLPAAVELSVYLVQFLWLCVRETAKLMGQIMGWAAAGLSKGTVWSFSQAALFCAILFEEWRSSPQEEDAEEFFEDEEDELGEQQNAYAQALALLGLTEPLTQEMLKQVYRQAMKAAHTDVGGSKEDAQALNAARDLIVSAKGWK